MRLHRVFAGVAFALTIAATIAAIAKPMSASICSIYTPDDPEYYLFMCFLDPPPKDPRT